MRLLLLAILSIALSGCGTVAPVEIDKPEQLQPIESTAESSKTIYVANVTSDLVDKKIGQMKGGLLCVGGIDLIWADRPGILDTFKSQIRASMTQHGYNQDGSLIQVQAEKEADILIGIGLESVKANVCSSLDGEKGEASLTLKWDILDNKRNKSLTLTTVGSAHLDQFDHIGDPNLFVQALKMATENLLAQKAFFDFTRK